MKKTLVLLLALCLLLGCFAACGSTAQSAAEEAPASAESAQEQEASVAAAPAPAPAAEPGSAEEPAETEGSAEELELAELSNTIEYPLVDEPTTLTLWMAWPPFLSDFSEPSDAATFAELETLTGIHLDISAVSTENDSNDFMLRCASGDLTDLIQKGADHYTGGGTKAIEDEVLIDLLPYLPDDMPNYWKVMEEDDAFRKSVINDAGYVPTLFGMYKEPYYTDQGYWIRQDIMDELGLDIPTTLEELEAVLAAFKDHGMTDGMVVLSQGTCELLNTAYGANNRVEDGVLVNHSLDEEGKQYMLKMNEWCNKGYINRDFVTYTYSQTKPPEDVVFSDNAGIFNEDVLSIAQYVASSPNPKFDLQPLAQIRLTPDQVLDTGYIGQYSSEKFSISVSAQCEDPDLALQYMNYLYTDDGVTLTNWGIEGVTYEVVNGEPQYTELITEFAMGMQLAQILYINPGLPCVTDLAIQESTYSEAQKAAVPTWVAAYDSSDATMPNQWWLTYTTEESQRMADLQADLETYQEEMRLKFVTGQADIEAEWDNYVASCKAMGYDEIRDINQAALDRYLAKG